ncbi:MAG: hypothetical protein QM500_00490 [Methylococcales bacterium]
MNFKNPKMINDLLEQHQTRITEKGRVLTHQHSEALSSLDRLKNKLNSIKKTYGVLKCMCVGSLKTRIARIKQIIKARKEKCLALLADIGAWERTCRYPFI